MADLAIGIEILGIDKFSSVAGGIQKGLGGLFEGASKLGMGVFGIGQLAEGIGGLASGMISGNAQMETYQSQLETLMGSADGARDRIAQLAKIGADTPFELPQLVQSEKIMMGFGLTTDKTMKLTGKSLDQFRTSIGDMAAGTGTDLAELTNLWGKFGSGATGEAISRMQELGIVTREQLTEVGVQFDKSGALLSPLPQAMEAAMKIADSKFGGGMQKLSQTFEGQMSTLADSFNQAKTAIMAPIFDVLKNSLVGLNAVLAGDTFKNALTAISTTMTGAVAGGIGLVSKAFDALADTLAELLGLDPGEFASSWDELGGVLARVGQIIEPLTTIFADAFDGLSLIVQQGLGGDMESAFANFGDLLQIVGLRIGDVLTAWGTAFVAWIGPIIPPLLQELLALVIRIDTWIVQTGLPMLIAQLADWAGAFVDWVGPLIPPMLRELGGLLLQVGSWMLNTALPAMLGNLAKWGLAFVEWVAPRIPLLMGEIMKLELELLGWIATQALPAIISKLGQWGAAFVDWVTKPLQELPGRLAMLLDVISQWVANSLNSIAAEAGKLGARFVQGIQDGISGAIDGFRAWLTDNVINAIPEWIRGILNLSSDTGTMARIGARMVEEMEIGIQGRLPSLEKLITLATERIGRLGGGMGGNVDGWLAAAMGITGVGADWLPGLRKLVSLESSGNPGAVNPIEVLGQHATGLLQMLPSTFRAHLVEGLDDILNPIHNAASSIRYIQSHPAYGHVDNIPGVSDGREFLGYAEGGLVPGPPGMGQWAWVHGGERISPPGQGGGVTNIFNFPNYLGSRDELIRQIDSGLAVMKGRNGRLAFER